MIPHVLTIAGSDPSGGAGIQADLKTFSALGCYGMSVIAALTAQNTQGVTGVHTVPPDFIRKQLDAIFDDIRVDALKIGMAGTPDTITTIAAALKSQNTPIVLDPVMISQSGSRLLEPDAVEALKKHLIPLATLITPNLPEAEVLLGRTITDPAKAAQDLLVSGVRAVLLKGGHGTGATSMDILATSGGVETFETPRLKTINTHGTGCTLSAALACFIAREYSLSDAVRAAKDYITNALKHADELEIGSGAGPVHHFHALWAKS